jgi:hypothetical protein
MRPLLLPSLPGADAADALGLAITHAHASRGMALMAQAGMGRAKAGVFDHHPTLMPPHFEQRLAEQKWLTEFRMDEL